MRARSPRAAGAVALAVAGLGLATPARGDDDFGGASVIFARGSALYRVDASGKGETEIAQLAGKLTPPAPPRTGSSRRRPAADPSPPVAVRALRSDAAGTVLLVDLAGKWAWMPLDGSTRSLTDLPCADGPAQLAEDGSSVLCRSTQSASQSIIVELPRAPRTAAAGKVVAVDVPPAGARLAGQGAERRLVWADDTGVWMSPPGDPKTRTRVAPDPPLRGFLPSPDGARAIGVYADQIFAGVKHSQPAEVLMTLQLDNQGARRKAIRDGVAVEWSHDSQWVLVQDGALACIMRVTGGQYKCWRGYTAASLSSDGRWGLVLGNRDGSKKQKPAKPSASKAAAAKRAAAKRAASRAAAQPASEPEPGDMPWDHIDEPSDEPESADAPPASDDVSVAPPTGALALFRVRLEGAFTDRPVLLVKVVDGAAVWVPAP